MKRLILISKEYGEQAAAQKLKSFRGLESPAWVFLGRSYAEQRSWTAALEGVAERLSLAGRLQQTASELKSPYLRLIAALGKKMQSDAWWASRISERNTSISHLFLYCCYLRIARQLREEHRGDLIVVAESRALLAAMEDWGHCENALEIRWLGLRLRWLDCVRYLTRAVKQVLRLALAFVQSRLWGKDNLSGGSELFLLHTYLDDACFGEGHRFRERYFPGLAAWLEAQGHTVAMLPVIFSVGRSYRAIWEWLRSSDSMFVNAYRYCHLSDYVHALAVSWRSARLPFPCVELVGLDVTRLFVEERRRMAFSSVNFLLYLRLPLRLRQHGITVRELVVEHENMIAEKLLTIGFRRHMPETKILGYLHSGLHPMLLCSQIIPDEAAFAPLPDRVLCNGSFHRNILKDLGMPEHLLVDGPALRHTHLMRLSETQGGKVVADRVRDWDVLVLLPMMTSDAAELLLKVMEAFARIPVQRVALKLHPMLSKAVLLREAGLDQLPEYFSVVTGDLGQFLHEARVVVCMSSTVILEVAAAGAQMIVVGRETALDFNPLGFMAESVPPSFLLDQLTEELRMKLNAESIASESNVRSEQEDIARLFNVEVAPLMPGFVID